MSRLTDLIAQAKIRDPKLGQELEQEIKTLASRRSFGLNFERHRPESVELPGRPVRKGDKVRILPRRGETKKGDQRLWKVLKITSEAGVRLAELEILNAAESETQQAVLEGLVVVAEFKDYIYPGLVSTGKVERGGDKPFHTVINGENFHALEALTFTHRGKIDAIYIDPPYNSGAKDWKYNNNYVERDDLYRHSKWLAFIERRLIVAKELLNPKCAVLIVAIDEKECLRLGLLLEQVFPDGRIQMISTLINPKGVARGQEFYRVDEYLFFVSFGTASVSKGSDPMIWTGKNLEKSEEEISESDRKVRWGNLLRSGTDAKRSDRKHQFYPIFLKATSGELHSIGKPLLPVAAKRTEVEAPAGSVAVWPIRKDGSEGRWQVGHDRLRELFENGFAYVGRFNGTDRVSFSYVTENILNQIIEGKIVNHGKDDKGAAILEFVSEFESTENPKTMWNKPSHSASEHGSTLLRSFLPGRAFPFPKSLYAVEDALRFFLKDVPDATVLDFFAGSGTTAHSIMRLNRQDGGRRQCISITNNEVAADEQSTLRKAGHRPGDPDWEKWGICDYITKPRIATAITGKTPEGKNINGDYKFADKFPMAEGFEENAEFFTLTYETPVSVSHNRAFSRIAPLLWMRAGSAGKRIDAIPTEGWEVTDTYGLLIDLDKSGRFCDAVKFKASIRNAYIVTDDERRFQSVARRLPDGVEPIRLYESYLTNFRFSMGR
tara:strand:+ start:12487 stop:14646 length:2160 start_codon:yes stop_codon:yes gene_type:complete